MYHRQRGKFIAVTFQDYLHGLVIEHHQHHIRALGQQWPHGGESTNPTNRDDRIKGHLEGRGRQCGHPRIQL